MQQAELVRLWRFDPDSADRAGLEAMVGLCGRGTSWIAAKELACLAALERLDDEGPDAATVRRNRTKCSKKAAKRAAKTAKQADKMPKTSAALAKGEITPEHADAAADAAERVSPEEADDELVGNAKARPADLFGRDAREWANRKERRATQEDRYARQRRNRSGAIFDGDDDMAVMHSQWDPITGVSIKAAVAEEVDRLWRADGGRDGSPDEVRTPQQRTADAIANLLLRKGDATKRPHPRYVAHLRVDVDRCAPDGEGTAEFIDGTPVPQAVLERLLCISAVVGVVYGADGSVLWQGSAKRLATDEQWHALVERDGGCFCCGAPPAHCEAHHLVPWDVKEATDIDGLLLVCTRTHHLVHDHGWTIENHDGRWELRRPGEGRAPPSGNRAPPGERAA